MWLLLPVLALAFCPIGSEVAYERPSSIRIENNTHVMYTDVNNRIYRRPVKDGEIATIQFTKTFILFGLYSFETRKLLTSETNLIE